MNYLEQMHPKVKELFIASGIKLVTVDEYRAMYDLPKNYPFRQGGYDYAKDVIFLNGNLSDFEVNNVMLHELVHSTGIQPRLARKSLLSIDHLNPLKEFTAEYAAEEQTAQYGAHLLFAYLNLYVQESIEYTAAYLEYYAIEGSDYKSEAQKAIDYLLQLVQDSKCKDKVA